MAAVLIFLVMPGAAAGYYFVYNVGTLSVYVTDDAIDDFVHLNITFSEVQVKSSGALTMSTWTNVAVERTTIDLVELRDNISARIALGRITGGSYGQVRLVVESANGELKSGPSVDVFVPSGELKTDASFTMRAQSELTLVLRIQVHQAGGQYMLRPVFGGFST